MDIWQLMIQFIFRLTMGVALAMWCTSPRWVTSGFYRVHLWVLLGLNTFAALAIYSQSETLNAAGLPAEWLFRVAIGLVIVSYVGSVIWLYEQASWGQAVLMVVTIGGVLAASLATPWQGVQGTSGAVLAFLDLLTGGGLLGATLAAMFLGHWYLNTPTMQLMPLRRLVIGIALMLVARAAVCGLGAAWQATMPEDLSIMFWAFVGLRWLAGLVSVGGIAWLTWLTLKIPNTQSATGLLYAAVILAFIGELTSQLLTLDSAYPV